MATSLDARGWSYVRGMFSSYSSARTSKVHAVIAACLKFTLSVSLRCLNAMMREAKVAEKKTSSTYFEVVQYYVTVIPQVLPSFSHGAFFSRLSE